MSPYPPVILLGVDTPIGLAAVRELGRAGIPVHAIARKPEGLGLHSRYLAKGYVAPPDGAATLHLIEGIARQTGAPFVIPVSTGDALLLREATDAGTLRSTRALVASADALARANSKDATLAAADALGIATPVTWSPRSADEASPDLGWPVVLKWPDPDEIAPALDAAGIPLLKSEYARNAAELAAALARYRPLGRFPLVQSYAAGDGVGHMILMHGGKVLLRFAHRRIAEWPPEGGVSSLCAAELVDPAAFAPSEALLRAIGWEGPAMVEYRRDDAGRLVLMEVNGRLWGSLPLASACGARFVLGTYLALGLGAGPVGQPVRHDLRARFFAPHLKRLGRLLKTGGRTPDPARRFHPARELAAFMEDMINARTYNYVWDWRDPRPALAGLRATWVRRRPGGTGVENGSGNLAKAPI